MLADTNDVWLPTHVTDYMRVLHTGSTEIANDLDPVGWLADYSGTRSITQSNTGLKPRWNATFSCLEFLNLTGAGSPRSLSGALAPTIAVGDDVTFFATVAMTATILDSTRGTRAMFGAGFFGSDLSYLACHPALNWPIGAASVSQPSTSGAGAGITARCYSGYDTAALRKTQATSGNFFTISASRSSASSNKMVNLYVDGSLVVSGPAASGASGSAMNTLFMYGPEQATGGTPIMRIKDVTIIRRVATPEEHAAYAAYGATI